MTWKDEQHFELNWHKSFNFHSYGEETKQIAYVKRMGIPTQSLNGKYPVYNFQNKEIIDIGGGPCSILLKSTNLKKGVVVDPCDYPKWISERYKDAGIDYLKVMGEELPLDKVYDEAIIYNCLQHTSNPKLIIENARKISKIIRIFEWIENGVSEGHPQNLHEKELNEWLGGSGVRSEVDGAPRFKGVFQVSPDEGRGGGPGWGSS
jgi:hypothetical protein